MSNLSDYGKKYLGKCLRDYAAGKLCLTEVKAYLNCCFDTLPAVKVKA